MINSPADTKIVALHRPDALPILNDVAECRQDEGFIARAGCQPEGGSAPVQQFNYVTFGGSGEPETCHSLHPGALLPSLSETGEEPRQFVHIYIAIIATRQGILTLLDRLAESTQFQHVFLMALLKKTQSVAHDFACVLIAAG